MTTEVSHQVSQMFHLSQDPETKGFDLDTGQTWIYPTNLPLRDYQFNIVKEALFKNTLVSLPTGLGKTFIAAVIMFNFYRWYPQSKVIFMAPTRPLVKQQINACYNIMAIPKDVTAELTGSKLQESRCKIWNDNRVFFITPQILQNDLDIIPELGGQIRCLVFDEAHRAKGNHAYCEVIRKLVAGQNELFRVLALSATPGNSIRDVLEIIDNLKISHSEFRCEESEDVRPYIFERHLESVVVPLSDKLVQVRDDYLRVLERYTRTLLKYDVIQSNVGNLTKGRIFMIRDEYKRRSSANTPNYNEIMKTLLILTTLYHAFELLIRNGLRGFLNFFKCHIDDQLVKNIAEIKDIMRDVDAFLGPEAKLQALPDGSFTGIDPTTKFGHPKFYKLREILQEHFKSSADPQSSRVIVFFEFRECVKEAHALLIQDRPIIRPRIFIGQSNGVTQKIQINVVKNFRDGECNTLLATCIGEEGLDVGQVDLIVCFDIVNKSPIRMIQRMGRTGRKREGKVIVLVTEGKEQQTLKDCMVYKNNVGAFVLNSKQLTGGMFKDSPRMIPTDLQPKCLKLFMTVPQASIKTFGTKSNLDDFGDFAQIGADRLGEIDFSKNLEQMRNLQPTFIVKHSIKTTMLVDLLRFSDSKRFNLPMTQNLKQCDIRSMFASSTSKSLSQGGTSSQSTSSIIDYCPDISDYISIYKLSDKECDICGNFFDCTSGFQPSTRCIDLKEWVQPNESILGTISGDVLDRLAHSFETNDFFEDGDDEMFSNIRMTQFEKDSSEDREGIVEKSFAFQAPDSLNRILQDLSMLEKPPTAQFPKIEDLLKFFKLSSLDDLFVTNDDDLDRTVIYTQKNTNVSPDLFETSPISESPILSCFDHIRMSQMRAKRQIFDGTRRANLPSLRETPKRHKNVTKSPPKSLNQSKYFPNEICDSSQPKARSENYVNLDISDLCDLSEFGLSPVKKKNSSKVNGENTETCNLDLDDICDLSHFKLDKASMAAKSIKESQTVSHNDRKVLKVPSTVSNRSQKSNKIDLLHCGFDQPHMAAKSIEESQTAIENDKKVWKMSSPVLNRTQKRNRIDFRDINTERDGTSSHFSFDKPSRSAKSIEESHNRNQKSNKNDFRDKSFETISQAEVSITQIVDSLNEDGKVLKKVKTIKKGHILSRNKIDLSSTNSEDEFEEKTIFIGHRRNKITQKSSHNRKKRKIINEFIDNEAILSPGTSRLISDDEESEGMNEYDPSFIHDTEDFLPNTQVQSEYLKSIKSPTISRGKFKIPDRPKHNYTEMEIYSQPVDNHDDTYLNDSFCVDAEDVECTQHDLSELEILELKLKEQRKRKCSKASQKHSKRKKILIFSDDSDN